jgi:WD40 repeat protein
MALHPNWFYCKKTAVFLPLTFFVIGGILFSWQFGSDGEELFVVKSLTIPTHSVDAVSFSPDGRFFATAGNPLSLWETITWREKWRIGIDTFGASYAVFSPDGKLLATRGHSGAVIIWDISDHNIIKTLNCSKRIASVCFSSDGQLLATCGEKGFCCIWDISAGITRIHCCGHKPFTKDGVGLTVQSVVFSSKDDLLATGSMDRSVKLWSPSSGKEITTLSAGGIVNTVAFSPDGETLAFGDCYGVVTLWDVRFMRKKKDINFSSILSEINALSFSSTGGLLAISGRGQVCILDMVRSRIINLFKKNRLFPNSSLVMSSVAFSPDGKILAIGSYSNMVKIIDLSLLDKMSP